MCVIDKLKEVQNDPDRMLNLDDAHNLLEKQQVSSECKVQTFAMCSLKKTTINRYNDPTIKRYYISVITKTLG